MDKDTFQFVCRIETALCSIKERIFNAAADNSIAGRSARDRLERLIIDHEATSKDIWPPKLKRKRESEQEQEQEQEQATKIELSAPRNADRTRSSPPVMQQAKPEPTYKILVMQNKEIFTEDFHLGDHKRVWLGPETQVLAGSEVLRRLFAMKKSGNSRLDDAEDRCLYDPTYTKELKPHYPNHTKVIYWDGFCSASDELVGPDYFISQDEEDMWIIWFIWAKWLGGKQFYIRDYYQKLCALEFAEKMKLDQGFVTAVEAFKFPEKE